MKKRDWGTDPYFFGPRNYFRQTLLVKYLNRKNKKVLDAGCGNESLSIRLSKMGFDVSGIDVTKENISFANSVKKVLGIKNLDFSQMSLTDIKFKKNSFDAVVSGEVLEHIKKDEKAVKEFNRVLKMNGQCLISVPQNPKLWSKEDEWVRHFRRYTRKGLVRIMQKNGFKVEKIRSVGFPIVRLYFCFFNMFVLKNKIKENKKTPKSSFLNSISKLFSYIFFLDLLFSNLDKGNWLILSAKKIKDIE
jgi:ubiquinone/menaquinone biosynthesis C-methylase UbiE